MLWRSRRTRPAPRWRAGISRGPDCYATPIRQLNTATGAELLSVKAVWRIKLSLHCWLSQIGDRTWSVLAAAFHIQAEGAGLDPISCSPRYVTVRPSIDAETVGTGRKIRHGERGITSLAIRTQALR